MTDDGVDYSGKSDRTSSSLLVRVKARDQAAWGRLVQLYTPLVLNWCRRHGLQKADAADVSQEVFRTLAASIADYQHDRHGDSFRGWLFMVTRSRMIDFQRREARAPVGQGGSTAQALIAGVAESPDESSVTDDQDNLILVRRAIDLVLEKSKEKNRQAFLRVVVSGDHPADVANDLGMSVNAVYLAKSHILRRLRDEFGDLIDFDRFQA